MVVFSMSPAAGRCQVVIRKFEEIVQFYILFNYYCHYYTIGLSTVAAMCVV